MSLCSRPVWTTLPPVPQAPKYEIWNRIRVSKKNIIEKKSKLENLNQDQKSTVFVLKDEKRHLRLHALPKEETNQKKLKMMCVDPAAFFKTNLFLRFSRRCLLPPSPKHWPLLIFGDTPALCFCCSEGALRSSHFAVEEWRLKIKKKIEMDRRFHDVSVLCALNLDPDKKGCHLCTDYKAIQGASLSLMNKCTSVKRWEAN